MRTTQDKLIEIRKSLAASIADHMIRVRDISPDSKLCVVGIDVQITCADINENLDSFSITV